MFDFKELFETAPKAEKIVLLSLVALVIGWVLGRILSYGEDDFVKVPVKAAPQAVEGKPAAATAETTPAVKKETPARRRTRKA